MLLGNVIKIRAYPRIAAMYQDYRNQLQANNSTGTMANKASADEIKECETFYEKLQKEGNKDMLLKKHLTKDVFDKLKTRKTKAGGTLANCIKSGALHPKSHCGLYACDADAYEDFKELFQPVIKDYHKTDHHESKGNTDEDFGVSEIDEGDLDTSGMDLIKSTRIRIGRSFEGKGFCPTITKEDRTGIEKTVEGVLNGLTGELAGKYFSLETMSKEDKDQLIRDHFLFTDDDNVLGDAGGYRDWPSGRGIYLNSDKTFLVWLNEEDHLRFISMEKGGNVKKVYNRLVEGTKAIEKKLAFARSKDYGYLTCCPTNLGTTMRASVHIDLSEMKAKGEVDDYCKKYYLQPRGTGGESTKAGEGGIYDISNKSRLGNNECKTLKGMIEGIKAMVTREAELRSSKK